MTENQTPGGASQNGASQYGAWQNVQSQDRRTIDDAWRQVGVYMETIQSTWDRLARRNFDLWKDIAGSLRTGQVDADKLAANSARAMAVAQQTAEDLWFSMVEPPQREVYVQVLPTAFLFFDKVTDTEGGQHYTGQDPVHIPVNRERQGELPLTAEITLSGNPVDPKANAANAIKALTDRLQATRLTTERSYLLQTISRNDAGPLVPGTYDGLVYLMKPTLPLANLRIVVEGPPPEVNPET